MQQINLYQDQFKAQRKTSWMALLGGSLLVLLVLMTLLGWYQKQTLQKLQLQLQCEESRQQQLLEGLDALQQKMATSQTSALLRQQLRVLQRQLRCRRPLRAALERILAQKNTISARLEGLASKPLKQLWFTQVALSNGGAAMRLQGLATQPDRVPALVEFLSRQSIFSQQHFAQLQLERQENGLYQFVLSTELEEEK